MHISPLVHPVPIPRADVIVGPGGTLTFQRPVILTGSIQGRAWQISYTAAVPGGPSANCTAELCRCATWRCCAQQGQTQGVMQGHSHGCVHAPYISHCEVLEWRLCTHLGPCLYWLPATCLGLASAQR